MTLTARCVLCGSLHTGGDTCIFAEVVADAYGPGEHGVRFRDAGNTLCPRCQPGGPMTRMLRKKLDQRTDRYLRRLQTMMRERELCPLCLPGIEWHEVNLAGSSVH